MDLSIVIPAYNESQKIQLDIQTAAEFLQKEGLSGEIIVVDDGSTDHTEKKAQTTPLPKDIILQVIHTEENRGKGHAIRSGMIKTQGDYCMFADSGYCVPYENVQAGLSMIQNGECEIAHGSRKMQGCHIIKKQNLYRRMCSGMFHWMVIYAMNISREYTDTQCGFKVYRGDIARNLYSQCIIDGFMFDIETIVRAEKMGYRIREFPVEWTNDRDSRLSPVRSFRSVLKELIAIKQTMANE